MACFFTTWTGVLVKLDWYLELSMIPSILAQNLQTSVRQLKKKKKNITFKHEMEPKHRPNSINEWLQKYMINIAEWPQNGNLKKI